MSGGSSSPRQADCRARLAAQTVFDRPLVLEAGAGTGKTAALVARIAAWCLGPGWELEAVRGGDDEEIAGRVLEGVVAITFTDAAAAEMAGRVAEALRALEAWDGSVADSSECPGDEVVVAGTAERPLLGLFRRAFPEDVPTVRVRARALLSQVERLRTSTIHAFAASVLLRFPVETGLRPGFRVDADGTLLEEMVETAADEVLTEAYAGGEGLDDALRVAASGLGPAEVAEAALQLIRKGVPATALADDPFTEEAVGRLMDKLAERLLPCAEDAATFADSSYSTIKASGDLLAKLASQLRDFEKTPPLILAGEVAATLRADFTEKVRKKLKNEWGKGKFGQSPPKKLESEDFADRIAAAVPLLDLLEAFDHATFSALRRLLHRILHRVEDEKRRRGVVGFQDLLVRGRRLLEGQQEVCRRLRAEIRQLLVDEMQDTDAEQARIVELLALEGGSAERPCLFIVGDPKQSIYGWRSADLAVYERLVRGVESQGGERHDLVVNFRSVPAVLVEVERVIGPVMTREEGLQPDFVALEPCSRLASETGHLELTRRPVEHWIASESGEGGGPPTSKEKTSAGAAARLEASAVAADIAGLEQQDAPLSEMAILLRSRSHLETVLAALRERGIPYVVGGDRSFFRTREVVEAMSLIRLVLDHHDPLALAVVLRSPLVGVPDGALEPLWRNELPGLTAKLVLKQGALPAELGPAVERAAEQVEAMGRRVTGTGELGHWPEALTSFLETLACLRASFEEDPPDRFLENLRLRTLVEPLAAGRFPGPYRLANVDRFLRALEDRLLEGASAGGLLRWLRRMGREQPDEEGGRPREDAGEAVRVLTIHGAKGLEFEHAWLLQTHGGGGWRSGPATDAGLVGDRWELALAGIASPGFPQVEERRRRVEEAEKVRLLYVALTRAKRRIVTSGCWNPTRGGEDNLMHLLRSRRGEDGSGWPGALGEVWTAAEGSARVERDSALWVLLGHPAIRPERVSAGSRREGPKLPDLDKIGRDEVLLRGLRTQALERQERPFLAGVSHEAHRELAARKAAAVEGTETPEEETAADSGSVPRDVATAVGTAVHRVLEHFDLGAADPDAELERRRGEVETWLAGAVAGADVPAARERLAGLLERLRSGPLWSRWLELKAHVLARELPVLLPPPAEGDGPVGALAGVLDLLYADPETGAPVVVDYKTDDPQMIEDRTAGYAAQLAFYAEAVRAALRLDEAPRTELWFLAVGEVVHVDPAGGT